MCCLCAWRESAWVCAACGHEGGSRACVPLVRMKGGACVCAVCAHGGREHARVLHVLMEGKGVVVLVRIVRERACTLIL